MKIPGNIPKSSDPEPSNQLPSPGEKEQNKKGPKKLGSRIQDLVNFHEEAIKQAQSPQKHSTPKDNIVPVTPDNEKLQEGIANLALDAKDDVRLQLSAPPKEQDLPIALEPKLLDSSYPPEPPLPDKKVENQALPSRQLPLSGLPSRQPPPRKPPPPRQPTQPSINEGSLSKLISQSDFPADVPDSSKETRNVNVNFLGWSAIEEEELPHVKSKEALAPWGSDLMTPQGNNAESLAAKVNGYLISSIAHADKPAFETKTQFLGAMDAFEKFIDGADLNDENDCKMLNRLASFLHKEFNPQKGGIGLFQDAKKEWKNEWNDIDEKKPREFKAGNPENANIGADFKKMIGFFKDNAEEHFGPNRYLGGRELAGIQTASLMGAMYVDAVFDKSFKEPTREKLANAMVDAGLVHQSLISDPSSPPQPSALLQKLEEMKDKLRKNPLLAEVAIKTLQDEIQNSLGDDKKKTDMINFISGWLTKSNPNLEQKQLDALASKIYAAFIKEVANIEPQTILSGGRGRMPLKPALGGIPGRVKGDVGKKESIAIAPHRGNDKISDGWVKAHLTQDEKIERYFMAVEGDEKILNHGMEPKTTLRLGTGLDTNFVRLLDPSNHFNAAIKNVLAEEQEMIPPDVNTVEALVDLSNLSEMAYDAEDQDGDALDFLRGYHQLVGTINVTFNKLTNQKKTLKEFADMPSVAKIMYVNDIRLICSISGTTTDVVLSLLSTYGEEETKKFLQPFLQHIRDKREGKDVIPGYQDPLQTDQGKKFKQIASSIAFFMQAGKYHTAGEVVGGLYIAASSLSEKGPNLDIDSTYEEFQVLMEEFSKSPQTFLAPSDEDVKKLTSDSAQKRFNSAFTAAEKSRRA